MCCADVITSPLDTYPSMPTAPESVSERLARLQSLCLALTAATTVRQTASVVIAEGFAALGAAAGSLYLLETKQDAPDAGHFAALRHNRLRVLSRRRQPPFVARSRGASA